ncbi:hypothetical protein [Bradyrhizobium sp. NAS96.2]|uniref:hypothetical protein n=1 Tax=Bradyrhizobium sp. NAS96.2 TaxID=1680160 RepID=UPI00093ABEDD|nr:hypothetical protein [Bradyrhizobium sp. NAS96.2]OKO69889.1 hypothetical protein AC628_32225 [Bradyrhizobium sp. NAS96.2]
MPFEIDAKVAKGFNAAAYNIPKQIPFLVERFPQIADCHRGTINLALERPLQVRLPNIVTPPLDWNDPKGKDIERFGFTRIGLSVSGDPKRYEAWIYTAENSKHRFNDYLIEVVAETIPGIAVGVACKVFVDRAKEILVI